MIVVIEGFNPSVSSFNREPASKALGGEQLVPISFAISLAFLQEEWAISKQFTAVSALEALWMEFFADGVQAISLKKQTGINVSNSFVHHLVSVNRRITSMYLNFSVAFVAWWRQELFKAVFAIQVTLLFNEADVNEFTFAAWIHTDEVVRAPDLSQSRNERSPGNLRVKQIKFRTQKIDSRRHYLANCVILSYHINIFSTSQKACKWLPTSLFYIYIYHKPDARR